MSAFIVNDYHISRLVEYGERKEVSYFFQGKWTPFKGNEQAIFSKLIRANDASVNERYSENTPSMPGAYERDFERVLSPVQIIKACDCFDYQACEVENYEETEASKITDSLRHRAIGKLPGYEEAEWEIAPREINRRVIRLI